MPGKFFAKVNHDALGNGPTFFTDATGIQFDNRIPALQIDASQYTFELPQEDGLVNVRARLIYRRAFRFLVDAKQWTQDGHGNPLEDVLPPHYGHLMEQIEGIVLVGSETGACCHGDGSCTEEADAGACDGEFFGPGTTCGPTTCEAGICGDGVVDEGEECDDGNNNAGDGCGPDCTIEGPDVPALSTWGIRVLVLTLLALGAAVSRRRKTAGAM
jgi:cysteine-rich repeat protein